MSQKKAALAKPSMVCTLVCLSVLAGCSESSNDLSNPDNDVTASTDLIVVEQPPETGENGLDEMAQSSQTETEQGAQQVNAKESVDTVLPGLEAANRNVERIAYPFIFEAQEPTGLNVIASTQFFELNAISEEAPVLLAQSGIDECVVGSAASDLKASALRLPIDSLLVSVDEQLLQVAPIEVGQTIELSDGSGSYATLTLNNTDSDDSEISQIDSVYTLQAGADLRLEVPDELVFSAVGVATPLQWNWVKPISLDSSFSDSIVSIGTEPTLSWQAVEQSDVLQSEILLYAANIDELSGIFESFECVLQDDGEFVVPPAVQALFTNGFTPLFLQTVRSTRSLQIVEDVAVVSVFAQKM